MRKVSNLQALCNMCFRTTFSLCKRCRKFYCSNCFDRHNGICELIWSKKNELWKIKLKVGDKVFRVSYLEWDGENLKLFLKEVEENGA